MRQDPLDLGPAQYPLSLGPALDQLHWVQRRTWSRPGLAAKRQESAAPAGVPLAWRLDTAGCSLTLCPHQTVQSTVKSLTIYSIRATVQNSAQIKFIKIIVLKWISP